MGVFQILRTSTPDAAPAAGSLVPGALAVEMASAAPRLWVGTPTGLGYTGNMRLVVDSGAFLPLAGGTLATITGVAGGGAGLTIANTSSDEFNNRSAIRVTNTPAAWATSYGLYITNNGPWRSNGAGIRIDNTPDENDAAGIVINNHPTFADANAITINTSRGYGLYVNNTTTLGAAAVVINSPNAPGLHVTSGIGNRGLFVYNLGTGLEIDNVGASPVGINIAHSGSGNSLSISKALFNHFRVGGDGEVIIGTPTGPAVTGAGNVNIAGSYYQNGVALAAGIAEPATAGNYLRAMNGSGSWVAGLPLSGGTLTNTTAGSVLTVQATGATTGQALFIDNRTRPVGISIDQYGGTAAINISNHSDGVFVRNQAATSRGLAIQFLSAATLSASAKGVFIGGTNAAAAALEVERYTPTTAVRWRVFGDGSQQIIYDGAGPALDINNIGTGDSLRMRSGATDRFVVAANGVVTVGAPTGPAVTGAGNVNVSGGYYVNGVAVGAGGIAEPATAGNFLRTDTGTWVAGLPLTGGTLATLTGAVGGGTGLTVTNANTDEYNNLSAIRITNTPAAWATSYGIRIINNGPWRSLAAGIRIDNTPDENAAQGILINNDPTFNNDAHGITVNTSRGYGLYVNNTNAAFGSIVVNGGSSAMYATNAAQGFGALNCPTGLYIQGAATTGIDIQQAGAGNALDINNIGAGNSLVIRSGATNHFAIAADGTITLSAQAIASLQAALGI